MPANLTPQYRAAEDRFKSAADDREKMKALKEMMAIIPKHKGTDKLQADIKRKMARLKDEIDVKKSKGGHRFSFSVDKEGAAQIVVIGPPNVGKSLLVSSMSGTELEVADYPFTTRIFHPAMMKYEDIPIQLVDLPPLSEQYMENWLSSVIRISDMMILVLDVSRDDILEQMESALKILNDFKVNPEGWKTEDEIDSIHWVTLKICIIANKADVAGAPENYQIFDEFYGDKFEIIPVSAVTGTNLNAIKLEIMEKLKIIRVYSKRPGHDAEMDHPFTFTQGETLMDFAKAVHKDFSKNLKFARVWGANVFDGQRINKDYELQDKDIIELHL